MSIHLAKFYLQEIGFQDFKTIRNMPDKKACIVIFATVMCLGSLFGCQTQPPYNSDFDFMEGTWTTVKDGLSLTVEVVRQPEKNGWIETSMVDDGVNTASKATVEFDADANMWCRTMMLADGVTSTFEGSSDENGNILLEQVAYADRVFDPSISRLVYTPVGPDQFVMDWQSRSEGGEWIPRPEPFEHVRVIRPEAPGGEGRIAFISNREGNWEIYTIAPDGSDLINVTADSANDHFPRWIAGGSRLAFRSQRGRDDGGWDRWEIDIDGTDAQSVDMPARLNNPDVGTFPQIHPSGSYLVNAAEREGEQDIYVWRFDGGGERVVAPAPGNDYRPIFSPNGERILFISERDGNAEIYTVAFDGSELKRLTENEGIDRYARWSPDGSMIGFVSDRDGDLEVYVMDQDGGNVKQLTFNDAEDGEISWSPDSRKIAFRSDASGNGEVNVVDVDSGDIVNLTQNSAYDGEPVWSPPAS